MAIASPRHARNAALNGGTPAAPDRARLDRVDTWLFDLDNTLYSAEHRLFDQIDRRMTAYIARALDLDHGEARRLQKDYLQRYGTSLRGLILHHRLDPVAFLEDVHRIDYGGLPPAPALAQAIGRLPGRKLVFTNSTAAHAAAVLDQLGLAGCFEAVFDCAAADYLPKPQPEPYARLIARHNVAPARAAMVEDAAHNLAPAAALGMTTILVHSPYAGGIWPEAAPDADWIHHRVNDLAAWLDAVATPR